MKDQEEFYDEEYLEDDLLSEEREGKLQTVIRSVAAHPRVSIGGGSIFLSVIADIAFHLDPLWVVLGLAIGITLGWKGEDIMQLTVPGSSESVEDAEEFIEQVIGDAPIYVDQSPAAKFQRLLRLKSANWQEIDEENISTSLPQKRVVKKIPDRNISPVQGLTCERITTWFDEGRIDDVQFFTLLEGILEGRFLSPPGETGESVKRLEKAGETSESVVKVHDVSPLVSPEEEESVLQTYFSIQRQKGKVTREDIKATLQLNNKKHYIVKATCDKYGIAMPGGNK